MIQSPKFNSPALTSPLALGNFGNNNSDVQRLSEEVMSLRTKLVSWEDSWNQAKQACEAWRREAAEKDEKAKMADRERIHSLIKIGEVRKFCCVFLGKLDTLNLCTGFKKIILECLIQYFLPSY